MRSTATKTDFCKSFDWKIKLQWFDLTGLYKFKDGRVARVELDCQNYVGNYSGFVVTILNPKEGVVDRKFFAFDDYLDGKKRKDTRTDFPGAGRDTHFRVVSHTGWDWYIAEPATTRSFCEAVEAYIKTFA